MKFITQNTIQNIFKPNILLILKGLLIVVLCVILFHQVSKLDLSRDFLAYLLQKLNIPFLVLGVILVIPNYFFEILKWKILGRQIEDRNFAQSTKEVLRGLKLGIVTPLMLGDYYGRSIDFKKENRATAVALNLFNSLTQTWTSLLFGSIALVLWWNIAEPKLQNILLVPAIILCVSTFLGILLLYGLKPSFLRNWKFLKPYFVEFELSPALKSKIIGFSLARTLIYNLQYICFYLGFGIILSSSVYFIGINSILLAKTVGGGLNILGDLSIRELISINFFSMFGVDQRLVLVATFVVWLVNVLLPIIFGIIYKAEK